METRRESLSVLKLCRFCLSQDGTLSTLYERKRAPKNAVTLPLKILSCMSIEVFPSDKMPSYICHRCKFFMDITYQFKQICRQADENILQYVQKGAAIESITWPKKLAELYPIKTKKSPEFAVLETTESGATVQVTAHDGSDSEDEENMIDIKIGDGSEDGSKGTSIKLVAATNEDNKRKPIRTRKDSEEMDITYMRSHQAAGLTDGCWPCDECDCTYPLQQLLELHKMQKHRERSVSCHQCDAKFFSKYDLAVHQLRHTDEMLFQCVACDKQFKRLILLKRHEKLMHADLPQQHCPSCPASFLSLEELEVHQQKHSRPKIKQHVCSHCDKKFQDKACLQRHKEVVHDKKANFCCEYCPESFSTVSKLTRHVRSHAGERSYPCKYCDKSFLKSHHYTRHLRLKHRELGRIPKDQYDDIQDQYTCDQCDDCFTSQDELIYHSAIHATQNLICPLCQEKFDDVEAVTAHIRSHVNGTEFMCDFCELVFTTQEKLHNHMTSAHDEEIRNVEQEMEQEDSSVEMEVEDDDDENSINVKEENDHMVVEIKKAHEFMLTNESEEKNENTNSEESEAETTYTELATVDTLALSKETPARIEKPPAKTPPAVITKLPRAASKQAEKGESQTASILRKAEDIKRKASIHQTTETRNAQDKKASKSETNAPAGANDKSLRLLEKELQELKRTNTRSSDALKPPAKNTEILRSKRPQIHTSTPKPTRAIEEKKPQVTAKVAIIEKKQPERRVITKENKEPKEQKSNNTSIKEDKEKETSKNNVKNGTNEKNAADENIRRSTRPSKIKDYARMINDRSQDSEDDNDSDYNEESDEEEVDNEIEIRPKVRRGSLKQTPAKVTPPVAAVVAPFTPRKRGRPRKDKGVPAKIKKDEAEKEGDEEVKADKSTSDTTVKPKYTPVSAESTENKSTIPENSASPESAKPVSEVKPDVIMSPTGQTLKKVPIKSLPPGVKPLPLPMNARTMAGGEVCEMQIGKKMVKVQKIVMTKAEVEAMAKKGLVEMKDGTMVLKQGIKIPTSDPAALKSSLVGDTNANKESPVKKGVPTRCDLDEL